MTTYRTSTLVSILAVIAVVVLSASPVIAAFTVTTSESDFLASLSGPYYQEWFHDYDTTESLDLTSPLEFSGNDYSYTLQTRRDGTGVGFDLWSLEWPEPGAISVGLEDEYIEILLADEAATAIGGYFTRSDWRPDFVPDDVTVTFYDSEGSSASYITGSTIDGFLGVTSTLPIIKVTVDPGGSGSGIFATVDGIVVGSVVPEPSSVILLAAGVIGLFCYAWKRRG